MMVTAREETKKPDSLLILYGILAIANILLEYWHVKWGIYLTKPLLLSILSVYFYRNTLSNVSSFRNYLLLGLICSILGDSFLMFAGIPIYFMLGLGSFLMTHVFYIGAFAKIPRALKSGFVAKRKGWALFFLAYFIANVFFLWSAIPADLKIPVTIYSLAIISMAAFGLNLKGIISNQLFTGLFIGIILFVISDSLIAINKFHPSGWQVPFARLFIMTTYLTAQYLIATRGAKIKMQ